ncbi:MAG: large subunit ribosomal protein [Gaiellaceae bacterium]|jgi:large subunit ribosomal protein L21|nr:large subunit ribosomal protein [Gaiellaceae bacterium]MDX6488281.1 large subunit ribosomal protein [Gaiellaceae bacterium]
MATKTDSYAIIALGGKQYRVREGERLLVDRLPTDAGKTFSPSILMLGGDGGADFDAKGVTVTARVVDHVLGKKIRIGKYKPKKGYKRHNGYRSRLSQIEIESIGGRSSSSRAAKPAAEPKAAEAPKGLPKDYEGMTVAAIAEAAPEWRRPQLEAALEYEQAHAKRKGALAALESALAAKEES